MGLDLTRNTENTLTEPGALLAELELTAKRGFALDQAEFIDEMVAMAVPVKDKSGRFVASLATHGPKQRMELADTGRYEGILKSAAA